MSRLLRNADLPSDNVTRQDIYDLIEALKPQADLVDDSTVKVENDKLVVDDILPRWRKFTITYADLDTAANNHIEDLFALGTWGIVHAVFAKHSAAFTGGGASACTVSVGVNGVTSDFMSTFNIFQAPATSKHQYNTVVISNSTVRAPGLSVVASFDVTSALASELTAGSVDIYVLYSEAR